MHIERHQMPDGTESILKKVFSGAPDRYALQQQLRAEYDRAMEKETLREIRQVQFDPEDPCPCGSKRKAKNCCASRLLARLAAEADKKNTMGGDDE